MTAAFVPASSFCAGQRVAPSSKCSFAMGGRISVAPRNLSPRMSPLTWAMKIGIYYDTSTGNTAKAAGLIKEFFGAAADEEVECSEIDADVMKGQELLLVGAPTWNTGADTERSSTDFDEWLYDDLPSIDLAGKPVAIFGMGDSESYGEHFCDAIEELHDCFEKQGAKMVGYVGVDGYKHEESKAVRGDKFIGLPLDDDNEDDLTEGRITKWCEQVVKEAGIAVNV